MVDRDPKLRGARLAVIDARVVILLLDEARNRVIARVFGVPKENSLLVTIIGLGALAEALRGSAGKLQVKADWKLDDAVIATAVTHEALHAISGNRYRNVRFFGALVALAVLDKSFRPAVSRSFRAVSASERRVRRGLENLNQIIGLSGDRRRPSGVS